MRRAAAQSNTFGASFAKAESSLSRFAKRAALAGGAAGVGALVLGSKTAIDAATRLGESVNALNVVFGKASEKIIEFGKTAASTTGLSAREVNQSATVLGAALQNVGFSADQAADKTIELTQRAADMASVFDTDVATALGAIQAALRGESDPIEKFGVGLNEAAVSAKALELGLAKTTQEITAQDKAQARLALIIEQTNKVQGDFANTSGSTANQQRQLRAEIENLSAQLGTYLLPIVSDVLEKVLEWTRKLQDNKELQIEVKDAVEDLIDVARDMADVAERVAESVGGWGNAIKIGAGVAALTQLSKLDLAIGGILGKGGKDNPKGALGLAYVFRFVWPIAIAAGVGTALKNFKPFSDAVDAVIEKVGNIGGSLPSGTGGITVLGPDGRPVAGSRQPPPFVSPSSALTGGARGGVQLPTQIKSTHPTSGLAGFPAVDIFAKPGTPVRAQENGFITRIQGSATTSGGTYGWGLYFMGSKTGNTYFIKHLATTAKPGFYKRGAVIGTVSAWSGGSPHVHFGVHSGASPVARQSSTPVADDGGGGDTKDLKTNFQAIPIALRQQLADAELTKGTADDLRVLQKIRANLRRQLDSKKLKPEDRLEVTNALKDINREIEGIEDKHTEKLKEKARKKREAMLSAFKGVAAAALREFDKATQAGLAQFDALTPAEKELAEFRRRRDDEERARRRAEAMAIEDPYEREQRLRELDLEDQESALEARAQAEREARDKEREAYEEKRAADRDRLEEWLNQQEKALADGRKSWEQFYKDLRAIAIKYGFPVNPIRTPAATPQAARAATSGILPGIGSAAGGHVIDVGPDAGVAVVNVYVAGSVQAEQDLATTIRDTLARNGVRNDGTGL